MPEFKFVVPYLKMTKAYAKVYDFRRLIIGQKGAFVVFLEFGQLSKYG